MSSKTECHEKRTNYAYDPQKTERVRRLAAQLSTTLNPVNMSMLLDLALEEFLAKYEPQPDVLRAKFKQQPNGADPVRKRKATPTHG